SGACPAIRRASHVVSGGASAVDLDVGGKARLGHQVAHDRFGGGGAADIAQADETQTNASHPPDGSKIGREIEGRQSAGTVRPRAQRRSSSMRSAMVTDRGRVSRISWSNSSVVSS